MDWVIFVYVGAVFGGSLCGGALVNALLHTPLGFRIASLENSIKGQVGGKARQEQAQAQEAEMVTAISEALEMHTQGKPIPEIIKEVGFKHPAVAMSFIKQFMSGKLKLPAGMDGFLK